LTPPKADSQAPSWLQGRICQARTIAITGLSKAKPSAKDSRGL